MYYTVYIIESTCTSFLLYIIVYLWTVMSAFLINSQRHMSYFFAGWHQSHPLQEIQLIDPCFNQTVGGFKRTMYSSLLESRFCATTREVGIFQSFFNNTSCHYCVFLKLWNHFQPQSNKKNTTHPPTHPPKHPSVGGSKYGAEGFRASF